MYSWLRSLASWVVVFQDHSFRVARIGAGTVAVLCMNPLGLLEVKFQVPTRGPEGDIGRGIHASEG